MTTRLVAAAALVAVFAGPAWGQTPDPGRLLVTVADQTGGVIPNATVTVVAQDGAAAAAGAVIPAATTTSSGVATIEGLNPGRYTIHASFPGFDNASMRDVRVNNNTVRRTIVLPLKKVAEDVTVGRDKQSSALDPQGAAFSTVLTREQIAALPDDPDEMEKVLKAMAPPGANIRVDGFTGGKLPPKSQIRSIRLPRMDQIAAQNHGGLNGLLFIDILTQPGNGPLRGSLDFTFRDDALNAKNPFTPVKGDEGLRQGGFSLSGSIVPNKSSFSLQVQHAGQFDSTNLLAALPNQTVAAPIRRPIDRTNVYARFDQGISKDHMARFSFQRTASQLDNLGVGGYDLPDRAFSTTTHGQPVPHDGKRAGRPAVLHRVPPAGPLDGFVVRVGDRAADAARARCVHAAAARSRRAAATPWNSRPRAISTTCAASTPSAPACWSKAGATGPTSA